MPPRPSSSLLVRRRGPRAGGAGHAAAQRHLADRGQRRGRAGADGLPRDRGRARPRPQRDAGLPRRGRLRQPGARGQPDRPEAPARVGPRPAPGRLAGRSATTSGTGATFTAPARRAVATLRVNKAQFGTAVWLNGKKVGEYPGCFSAGFFDLTPTMTWEGENVLLVRVGAHPGVLPATYPAGTDFEKLKWTPGIYDERLAAPRGQPGDRDRPGGAAHRVVGDPGPDEAREPRARRR